MNLDALTSLVTSFVLICLMVAAGTEMFRRIIYLVFAAKGLEKPAWFTHLWRIVAVVIGCSCGWFADGWTEDLDRLEGLGLGAGVLVNGHTKSGDLGAFRYLCFCSHRDRGALSAML